MQAEGVEARILPHQQSEDQVGTGNPIVFQCDRGDREKEPSRQDDLRMRKQNCREGNAGKRNTDGQHDGDRQSTLGVKASPSSGARIPRSTVSRVRRR